MRKNISSNLVSYGLVPKSSISFLNDKTGDDEDGLIENKEDYSINNSLQFMSNFDDICEM
eukprot:Awhi_evm1s31